MAILLLEGEYKCLCDEKNQFDFLGNMRLNDVKYPCRFAAKEAAIKAHSHRRLTFHDIVIEKRPQTAGTTFLGSGPPVARIKGSAAEDEDASAMISISHDGDYATAVCLAHDPSVEA